MKQLIKAAAIYKAHLPETEALAVHLAQKPFQECQPAELRSVGFVPVHEESLTIDFPGGVLFGVRIDTKTIPSAAITKKAQELTKRYTELEGRAPGKAVRRDIKDAAVLELAKTAFARTNVVRGFYHRASGYLILPTTNQGVCDIITTLLVAAVGSIKTETIHVSGVKHGLTTRLKNWVKYAGDTDVFGSFNPCADVNLAQEKRKISIKMGELHAASSALNEAFSGGFEVTSLGFSHHGETQFRLTHDFRLHSIEFASTIDSDDNAHQGLAGTAALEVDAVVAIVNELVELLSYKEGDELVTEEADGGGYTSGPVSDGGMDPRDRPEAAHADGVAIDPLHHLEGDGPDPMYDQAVVIVKAQGRASISLVQRHLRIGYNRAARLLEAMEKAGLVKMDNTNGGYTIV